MSLAEGDVTGIVCDVASIAIPGLSGIKGIKFLESADEVAAIGKASKVIQTFDVGDEADHIAKSISDTHITHGKINQYISQGPMTGPCG